MSREGLRSDDVVGKESIDRVLRVSVTLAGINIQHRSAFALVYRATKY